MSDRFTYGFYRMFERERERLTRELAYERSAGTEADALWWMRCNWPWWQRWMIGYPRLVRVADRFGLVVIPVIRERQSGDTPPGGDSSPPSGEPDELLLRACADPGHYVERRFEPPRWEGDARHPEPLHRWQARACAVALSRAKLWEPTTDDGPGLWEPDQTDAAIAARERTRRRLEGEHGSA